MSAPRKKHIQFDLSCIGSRERLAGVDEVGRGCLAGPVVAGAVLLERRFYTGDWCRKWASRIDDSKKLSEARRDEIVESLPELLAEGGAQFATGMADAREVDHYDILGATKLAMQRALAKVAKTLPDGVHMPEKGRTEGLFAPNVEEKLREVLVLIDGKPLKNFPYEHTAIVGGDGKSLAIGLASIIAKVTRDRFISELAGKYPAYGFARNKGYGTQEHRTALLKYGPCELHRATFLVKILGARPDSVTGQADFPFA